MRSVRACVKGAKKSRDGFTLAEVIFGAGILAMFMLGLPLAIRMARNAVPDGGNTWTQNKSNDFEIMVYGQPNVASSGSSSTSYYLNDVRCLLRTNTNKSSRIVTTVRTYNQPQVPHP